MTEGTPVPLLCAAYQPVTVVPLDHGFDVPEVGKVSKLCVYGVTVLVMLIVWPMARFPNCATADAAARLRAILDLRDNCIILPPGKVVMALAIGNELKKKRLKI